MADVQLSEILQLVQDIASKQQESEGRLQSTEAAISKLIERSEEASSKVGSSSSKDPSSMEGLRIESRRS